MLISSTFKWNDKKILKLNQAKRAYIYYRHTRLNLLTGFPEVYEFDEFLKSLESIKLQTYFNQSVVFHFYYEFGLVLMGLAHEVDDQAPLVVEIEYHEQKLVKLPKSKMTAIPLETLERPTWTEYKLAFNKIQDELLNGNCYQVNLTFPYDFETTDIFDPRDITNFFFSRDNRSDFAHVTTIGDEMILSNSPECLFFYRNNKITTMPIKGTRKIQNNWREAWSELVSSEKEEGELNMITDLLRNDLNRLEFPRARVEQMRIPLVVPGLIHAHSVISVKIQNTLSLYRTMESLFPGGSVTGAPKKRVMQIIGDVERYSRGIYCGSTLLCFQDRKVASINIRTASVSLGDRIWRYGAGGGITLLSKAHLEFKEMEAKVSSFLTSLNVPGY